MADRLADGECSTRSLDGPSHNIETKTCRVTARHAAIDHRSIAEARTSILDGEHDSALLDLNVYLEPGSVWCVGMYVLDQRVHQSLCVAAGDRDGRRNV